MLLKDNSLYVPVENPNLSPAKTPAPTQALSERIHNFDETVHTYLPEQAQTEAERCLKCPGRYCAESCPAHVPVPEFIAKVRAGDYQGAYEIISEKNALPAWTGRVCAQEKQCESNCTRGIRGESVSIGQLEAFVADWHEEHGTPLSCKGANGIPVAIAGSGPAGLACADFLSRAGFSVTVYEEKSVLGGIPRYGIPEFVLPNRIVDRKIRELSERGVKFCAGTKVGRDVTVEQLRADYRAVFVATGAGRPVYPGVPGEKLPGVISANDWLDRFQDSGKTGLRENRDSWRERDVEGKQILVFGGGNTAVDCARSAVRAGARNVTMVYRRSEAELPARRGEILRAREEGVLLEELASPQEFLADGDKMTGVLCVRNEVTAPDYPGGRRNVAPTEENFTLPADIAVLALGYTAEPIPGLEADGRGLIVVDRKTLETSQPDTLAGGDAVTGANTLVHAMAAGRQAAEEIIRRIRG